MAEKSSVLVTIRLDTALHDRYSVEAATTDTPLSTYLRERLERQDDLREELVLLRRAVEQTPASPATSGAASNILCELLLLMRSLAKPEAVRVAAAELQRLGMEAWQPPAQASATKSGRSGHLG